MDTHSYIAYIEQDEDGMFVGSVPSVPGCHTQGETEEKLLANLEEVLLLCLRNSDEKQISPIHFVGIKELTVAHI